MIRLKRAYEPPEKTDGNRFLVDALWPRGLKKEALHVEWLKQVAPSPALRKWFGHNPARWAEFRRRYERELRQRPGAWQGLLEAGRRGDVTLIYSARDAEHNNAVVLRGFLEDRAA